MLSDDRKAFEEQLAVLFGGFPQFLTPPRIEAYWRGLQKMQLSMFIRCVDYLLGEQGSDKLPTVNTIWQTSKNLRAPLPRKEESLRVEDHRTNFEQYADHLLLNYFMRRGAPSRASLAEIIADKKRLCAQYFEINSEERITDEEFRNALHKAWDSKWKPQPSEEFNADLRQLKRIGYVTGTEPVIAIDREAKRA